MLVINRPRVSILSTDGLEPSYHHAPLDGSLKSASVRRGPAV